MDGRNCRLRRRKIGGAYLHGGGAQRESCRYSSSVRDSSRRDHRNADGVDDLRQERKQAGLAPYVLGQEHSAMAARLGALSDDRVDAMVFQPSRFRNRGRRRIDFSARLLDPGEQRLVGQAEMKTDNGGLCLLDDLGHRWVERRAAWSVYCSGRIQGGFGVVTRELIEPSRLPLGIGPWVHVAKEIDIEWRMRSSSDCGDLIAELRRGQHRGRQ